MRRLICTLLVVLVLGAMCGCDDEENIAGCRLYNHIYKDCVGSGTEHDAVYVFFAAGQFEEYGAPLTFDLVETASFTDSIAMELSVYGVSPTEDPNPHAEIQWRSDTLLIWYSSDYPHLDYIYPSGLPVSATPPCPMGYYRIDHVIVFHPPDIVVYPHEDVLY
jgi:hypothetical protein